MSEKYYGSSSYNDQAWSQPESCSSRDCMRSNENSLLSMSDLNTAEESKAENLATVCDQMSDGYSRSNSTDDSNFYIDNNKVQTNAVAEVDSCFESNKGINLRDMVDSQKKKDSTGATRLTAQQRKHLDVLQALTDCENRKKAQEGLVAAVQNDINKRFFMHEEKLKKFRAILSQTDKSNQEMIAELDESLGLDNHDLVLIVAYLMSNEEINREFSDDPQYIAVKKALTMILDVQAYVYGTRGLKTLKRFAANFRNEKLNDGEKLKSILKNLFRRDDKLYKLFIPDEPVDQSINRERYEFVNLSDIKNKTDNRDESFIFETIELPYDKPKLAAERPQPQLQHGNIIIENGGSETILDIRYEFNRIWNSSEDYQLLEMWRNNDYDMQIAAENFVKETKDCLVVEAYQRLFELQSQRNK